MKYPKEETLSSDLWVVDDHIDINGSAVEVWPWLAQMGNGRAGWYSYDWLDNLGRKSFDFIDPELVKISVNQKIPFAVIIEIEPAKYLTYQFGARASMSYFLEPLSGQQTRLWGRLKFLRPPLGLKMLLKPAHLFMQNKQFSEIKKRVERHRQS
jgi:hypothetical protein